MSAIVQAAWWIDVAYPVTVYGDGAQTRSFCYVDDMVDAFVRLMNSPDDVTGPINLGNPHELTMIDTARRIIALTGSASEIVLKATLNKPLN